MIYYIYAYYQIDYNNPIYIGKGKNNRIWEHFTLCLDSNFMFHKKLRSMLANNETILVKKLFENLEEDVAFQLEILLIKKYGRRDLKTGPLFNQTDGGDGLSGFTGHKGRELSFDARINMSVPKGKKYLEPNRKRNQERVGIPIESFDMITGKTIKKYAAIREACREGYDQSTLKRALRGQIRHYRWIGWRYSQNPSEKEEI